VHRLDERFQRTVDEELARPATSPPLFELRLPEPIKETIVELGEAENAARFYCERMPRMLIEQTLRGDDPARALLHRPIDLHKTPRLRAALEKLDDKGDLYKVIRDDKPIPLPAEGDGLRRYHEHLRDAGSEAAEELWQVVRPEGALLDLGGGIGTYSRCYPGEATLADTPEVLKLGTEH
jgi:hypothetical protein